jgi:hypothetical protein
VLCLLNVAPALQAISKGGKQMITIKPRDETYRTQDKAIAHHNALKEKMLSMSDVYKIAKENKKENIEALRKDFKDYLITSTRIIYNEDNLSAEIIHDYNSEVVKPKHIKVKMVSDLDGDNYDAEDLSYMQAMCDTKDNLETIKKNLQNLSGKNKIYWWTPTQESRSEKTNRAAGLYYGSFGGRFVVYGVIWYDYISGFSHGVLSDSAKQSKTKEASK